MFLTTMTALADCKLTVDNFTESPNYRMRNIIGKLFVVKINGDSFKP